MAIVSLDGRPVPPELPRAQLAAIAHRGEWEPRLWEAPGIALGHVNLPRTPEAEREFLPASDRSGRYWITWDGRLDNRDELGPKLGYDVNERAEKTDAEYVLDSFIKWADDCVHQLLGDWAVVIWDNGTRRLFCAKDPLGWRQLYYAEYQGLLAVGSEPQQFFANGWLPRVVNEDFILRSLGQAELLPNSSCWSRISELRGGEKFATELTVRDVRAHTRAPVVRERRYRRAEAYVDEFEELVRQATKARLRSNRRVSCLLSGGLDSSYTTAVAHSITPGVGAVTVFVPNSRRLDERFFARSVACRLGADLKEIDISACWYLSSEHLPDAAIDQPIIPGAGTSLRRLAPEVSAAGSGVLIGGEGGDEWLGGSWSPARHVGLASALCSGRIKTARRIAGRRRSRVAALKAVASAAVDNFSPPQIQATVQPLLRHAQPGFSRFVHARSDWVPLGKLGYSRPWNLTQRAAGTFAIYRQVIASEVGWRDRQVFGRSQVELRSPFNDWRVVEFLAATPDWAKQYSGEYRAILREALRRSGLSEIAERQTKGAYDELARLGMLGHEHKRFKAGLDSIRRLPGVIPEMVDRELERWRTSSEESNGDLLRLATAGLWLNQISSAGLTGQEVKHSGEGR